MKTYVIKCGAKGEPHYLASIEDGSLRSWSRNEYGTAVRAPKKKLGKDEDRIVRTATYRRDIEAAMTFNGIRAARAFIAKEPALRYCTPVLKAGEKVRP